MTSPPRTLVTLGPDDCIVPRQYLEELLFFKLKFLSGDDAPTPPASDRGVGAQEEIEAEETPEDFPDDPGTVILDGSDPPGMRPIGGFALSRAQEKDDDRDPDIAEGPDGTGDARGAPDPSGGQPTGA